MQQATETDIHETLAISPLAPTHAHWASKSLLAIHNTLSHRVNIQTIITAPLLMVRLESSNAKNSGE